MHLEIGKYKNIFFFGGRAALYVLSVCRCVDGGGGSAGRPYTFKMFKRVGMNVIGHALST